MRKKFYSVFVIFVTIVTSILMYNILVAGIYENDIYDNAVEVKNNKTNENKVETNKGVEKKVDDKLENNEEEAENKTQDENVEVAIDSKYKCEEFIGEDEGSNYKSIFKVDSKTIVNKLSIMDKLKLLKVASKLSSSDYKKLDAYLKGSNSEIGVTEAYRLLKSKLSKGDMDKVKDVLCKYIDVEVVEKAQ